MDPVTVVLLALAALLIGLALGWLLGGRSGVALRSERDVAAEKGRAAEVACAAAEARAARVETLERALEAAELRARQAEARCAGSDEKASHADLLRSTLNAVTGERDGALRALAEERAGAAERAQAFEDRLRELREAKDALTQQFGEIGGKLLGEAQKAFLERADQRFAQAHERGEAQLKALLQPVSETLKRHEESVGQIEKARTEAYGNLTGLIEGMRQGQEAVRGEAAKLVNALRAAPKARGRWGEQQLRNVLESCGMAEHVDFATEVSVESQDGRLRPDVIVHVPGGHDLVIDAKVSLNAYQDAHGATDEAERARHLSAHCASIKAHVDQLGRKAYWDQFAKAPDYVVMFVPGEHFLSAALEHDSTLWDYAFSKRVLLATPTNLIAIARTVAAVWRQEMMAKDAQAIGQLGREMHERLAVAAGLLKRVGGGLTTAVENYNKFVSSFESRVLVTGRRFKELNVDAGARDIEEPTPVEALARYGDALPAPADARAAAE